MKSLLITGIFFFLLKTAISQPTIEVYLTSSPFPSRGSVIESIEENYELLIKEVPPRPIKIVSLFNKDGMLTSEIKYGKGGGKQSDIKCEYNNRKLIKKTQKYFVNMSGWKIDETNLKYNDTTGFLTEMSVSKNNVQQSMCKVFCDGDGRPIDIRVLDNTGAYEMNEKLVYSPGINLVRVMMFKANNQFAGSYNYPIDPSKPTQNYQVEKQYYPNGDIMLDSLDSKSKTNQGYYYEYKYDSNGNWIEKETYQVTLGKNNKIKEKKLEHRITRTIKYY